MTNEIKTWQERIPAEWLLYIEDDGHGTIGMAMLAEIDELRAKVESLAADAERYQWLRHGDNDELVLQRGLVDMSYVYLPRNFKLDEMIDAAMAKEKA